ncbi:hypothetical protein RchiOBHm_Chr4g0401951 [Rosa chinensis]|uniref:Uncharacterized protein n=1 Tax=Rosa chinensis TaxID=74649 RepID=A0A2P6QT84_ROSCH|nr:hypothetical protein RchiOBHm_Chr4g0401951 [Rosa chinensis]
MWYENLSPPYALHDYVIGFQIWLGFDELVCGLVLSSTLSPMPATFPALLGPFLT